MYKITICGHFGGNKEFLDGQTVKTKNLYKALVNKYGDEQVNKIDTYNWKKNPFKMFLNCIRASKNSENIIILPAHNGVKVFVPLFVILNKKHKFRLFYDVIGGWLPSYIENKKNLIKNLKKIDKIFVETNKMKNDLEKMGFNNIEKLVNFKTIKPIKVENLKLKFSKPYHICTFSRVMKEKGIENIVNVVKKINKKEVLYTLDIYGPVDDNYKENFEKLQSSFPNYIKYKGCIDSNLSTKIIQNYYLLIFPTRFKTEGIPGTIIDSYFSGVPVIATRWENVFDIVDDNKTGYVIDMYDDAQLEEKLLFCLDKKNVVGLKENALIKAQEFVADAAIKNLIKYLK